MQHKIYPAAHRRIIEIWHYTDKVWGEKQADKYIHGLYKAISLSHVSILGFEVLKSCLECVSQSLDISCVWRTNVMFPEFTLVAEKFVD
jgi:hypothetical protein